MAYVHFDLAEVERQMRAAHARAVADKSAGDVSSLDRFFEPILGVMLQAVSLRNEGVPPDQIGVLVGNAIGNMIVNAVSASASPKACLKGILETSNAIIGHVSGGQTGVVPASEFIVEGTRGGRA